MSTYLPSKNWGEEGRQDGLWVALNFWWFIRSETERRPHPTLSLIIPDLKSVF